MGDFALPKNFDQLSKVTEDIPEVTAGGLCKNGVSCRK